MAVTTKDIVGLIISLTERVEALETKVSSQSAILDEWPDTLASILERLEPNTAPAALSLTGDANLDPIISAMNEKDAVISELYTLVAKLQDEMIELREHHHAQTSRLGTSINLRALHDAAERAERETLRGFRS